MARGAPKTRGKKTSSPVFEPTQSTLAFGQAAKPSVITEASAADAVDDGDIDSAAGYAQILLSGSTQSEVADSAAGTATRTPPTGTPSIAPQNPPHTPR